MKVGLTARTCVVTFVVGCALEGCSASESDKSPVAQCHDFVVGYCAKTSDCVAPSDRSRQYEDCTFNFDVRAPCAAVTGVQGDMETCLQAISALDCGGFDPAKWLPIPDECAGVLVGNGSGS